MKFWVCAKKTVPYSGLGARLTSLGDMMWRMGKRYGVQGVHTPSWPTVAMATGGWPLYFLLVQSTWVPGSRE